MLSPQNTNLKHHKKLSGEMVKKGEMERTIIGGNSFPFSPLFPPPFS
jgi:hypothetical protein